MRRCEAGGSVCPGERPLRAATRLRGARARAHEMRLTLSLSFWSLESERGERGLRGRGRRRRRQSDMAAATDASRAPRIDSFISAARPGGSGWSDAVPRKFVLFSSSSPTRPGVQVLRYYL